MTAKIRGATIIRRCACGAEFTARVADVKRGWAASCSKSCAATRTNKKTGNYQRYVNRNADAHLFSNEEHDCNKD